MTKGNETIISMDSILRLVEQGKVTSGRHFKSTDDENANSIDYGSQIIYEFSDVLGEWVKRKVYII
jgi:hypothetical protein